jgi:hypothetical protein
MVMVQEKNETPVCPSCGKPMQPKKPLKQSMIDPDMGPPLDEFECGDCRHIEGRHKTTNES